MVETRPLPFEQLHYALRLVQVDPDLRWMFAMLF